jgi:GNAT superfamily N-acetyltransferase
MEAQAFNAAPKARYRMATPSDDALIYRSWLKSYAKADAVSWVPRDVYLREYHRVVKELILRSKTLVACDPLAPDVIWGFIVFEEKSHSLVLHYLYVKQVNRRAGIGRRLVETAISMANKPLEHSHRTEVGRAVARKFNSKFHPEAGR